MKFIKNSVLLLITILLFTNCKLIDGWTHFEVDVSSSVVLPQDLDINKSEDVYPEQIEADIKKKVKDEGADIDKIESIELTDLILRITSPSGKDFSFFNSVTLYMKAEGLEEIKFAWQDNIPESVTDVMALKTSSSDFTDYLLKDVVTLRLNTIINEGIPQDYNIGIDATFLIDVKILGI